MCNKIGELQKPDDTNIHNGRFLPKLETANEKETVDRREPDSPWSANPDRRECATFSSQRELG